MSMRESFSEEMGFERLKTSVGIRRRSGQACVTLHFTTEVP